MKFNVVKFCTNLTKFFYKLRTSAKGEGEKYVKCGQMRTGGEGGGSKKWSFCADVLYGRPPCVYRACMPASMYACLNTCSPAYLQACLSARQCMQTCLYVCPPVCKNLCLHACIPACMLAFLSVCLPAFMQRE